MLIKSVNYISCLLNSVSRLLSKGQLVQHPFLKFQHTERIMKTCWFIISTSSTQFLVPGRNHSLGTSPQSSLPTAAKVKELCILLHRSKLPHKIRKWLHLISLPSGTYTFHHLTFWGRYRTSLSNWNSLSILLNGPIQRPTFSGKTLSNTPYYWSCYCCYQSHFFAVSHTAVQEVKRNASQLPKTSTADFIYYWVRCKIWKM